MVGGEYIIVKLEYIIVKLVISDELVVLMTLRLCAFVYLDYDDGLVNALSQNVYQIFVLLRG